MGKGLVRQISGTEFGSPEPMEKHRPLESQRIPVEKWEAGSLEAGGVARVAYVRHSLSQTRWRGGDGI